jgi:hypothetical protein
MAVDVGPAGAVAKKFPSPDDYNSKNGANFSSGFRRTMPNKPVGRFGRIAKKISYAS